MHGIACYAAAAIIIIYKFCLSICCYILQTDPCKYVRVFTKLASVMHRCGSNAYHRPCRATVIAGRGKTPNCPSMAETQTHPGSWVET